MFNKKIKKEVDLCWLFGVFWLDPLFGVDPPLGAEKAIYMWGGWWEEQRMYGSIELAENAAMELKEVLCKYGLEKDQQALWAVGVREVDHIPWMSEVEMRDARLTGTFEQYVAMQEGEHAVGEKEEENWYCYGEE